MNDDKPDPAMEVLAWLVVGLIIWVFLAFDPVWLCQ